MTASFFTGGVKSGSIVVFSSGSGVGVPNFYRQIKHGTFNQKNMEEEKFVLFSLDEDAFFTGEGYGGSSLTVKWLDFCEDTDWWFDRGEMFDTFLNYSIYPEPPNNNIRYEPEVINKWLIVPATPLAEDDEEIAKVDWSRAMTVAEFILDYADEVDEWNN